MGELLIIYCSTFHKNLICQYRMNVLQSMKDIH